MVKRTFIVAVALAVSITSCHQSSEKKIIKYVNPLIGASFAVSANGTKEVSNVEYGQVIPAVTMPFGMTQWTPQSETTEKKCVAPFYGNSPYFQGFRASHWLSGSCTQDYGSFTFMPINDVFRVAPTQRQAIYDNRTITTSPSYFSIFLQRYTIMAEMTATKRAGFFRFSWLTPNNPHIIIDINSDEGRGYIKIDVEKNEVSGYNPVHRIYNGNGKSAGFSGYFVARFDVPIKKFGVFNGQDYFDGKTEKLHGKNLGGYVGFDLSKTALVKVKVGTSFTSVENARKNLDEEIPHWNFEQTKTELENEWNTLLGKIEVEGGANDDLIKFYTAMYHSFMHPRLFSDVDGSYVGFGADSTIHKAIGYDYYSDFSAWDTYRAQMPLVSLIAPKHYKHMIQSLIAKAEQGGWMPTFPLWNNYTSAMIGDHVSTIIGDAYLKGFDIDIKKAWPYMLKNAFESPAIIDEYVDGKGRRGIESYKEYGYIPLEDQVKDAFHQKEQVSRTLEYAYDDWVLAQVAKKIGKDHDSKNLSIRSENYTNVYDTEKGWVCGRFKDGSFTDDFGKNEKMPYITEGTPKQYTWYVPHNIPGLIDLMGGEKKFKEKLSTFIDKKEYWHGNEPSHHIPYLFNYIGDWKKTQETVKNILKSQYGITNLGGLAGNDDAGQLSAWYVFSAMGFYPVCPGSNEYQLSSPIFEKVTINLDQKYFPGKKFVFNGDSLKNYGTFNKVKLNGKITNPVLLHNDLIKGGQLDYITEQ